MARRAAGSCLRPDVALRARRRRGGHLPAALAARHRGTAPLSRLLLPADVPPSLRVRRLDDARRLFLVRGPLALRILLGRLGPPPLPPGGPAGRRPGVGPPRRRAPHVPQPRIRLVSPRQNLRAPDAPALRRIYPAVHAVALGMGRRRGSPPRRGLGPRGRDRR